HNGLSWLSRCLKSLRQSSYPLEIIAVDNGSTDGTQEFIRSSFPEVELVLAEKNLGFGVANNIGVKRAMEMGSRYAFLFNQDAYIHKDAVLNSLPYFQEDPQIALISPIHLNGTGDRLDLGFQSCLSDQLCPGYVSDIALNKVKPFYPIYSVNAAAWILDLAVVRKIGLFSPAFYHYGEDINFQQRLQYFGYSSIIVTNAFIYHDRDHRKGEKSETGKLHEVKTNQLTLLLNLVDSFSVAVRRTLKYSGLLMFEKKYRDGFKVFFDTVVHKQKYKRWREEMKRGIAL